MTSVVLGRMISDVQQDQQRQADQLMVLSTEFRQVKQQVDQLSFERDRKRRIQEIVDPVFSNMVYDTYEVYPSLEVKHHARSAAVKADVIVLKKSQPQIQYEIKAVGKKADGGTFWSSGHICLHLWDSWNFYHKVLEQEDLLNKVASLFSEKFEELNYQACAVYDQNEFSSVCPSKPTKGYCYHFVALFHHAPSSEAMTIPRTYLACSDNRMRLSMLEKGKNLGLYSPT